MSIFCTSGAAVVKAGLNANISGALLADDFINQAEGFINVATRKNWSDSYAALNTDVKSILEETASNLAGIYIILYDMSGFTSRSEAESMITVLRDGVLRNVSILRDLKAQEFIDGA